MPRICVAVVRDSFLLFQLIRLCITISFFSFFGHRSISPCLSDTKFTRTHVSSGCHLLTDSVLFSLCDFDFSGDHTTMHRNINIQLYDYLPYLKSDQAASSTICGISYNRKKRPRGTHTQHNIVYMLFALRRSVQ